MSIEEKILDILHRLKIGMIDKFDAKTEILNLFNVSGSYFDGYKITDEELEKLNKKILQIKRICSDL